MGRVGCVSRIRLVAKAEGNIHEAERLVGRAGGRVCVFARSKQEEETERGEVGGGQRHRVVAEAGGEIDVVNQRKRDGFYAGRWWVDALVSF